MLPEHVFPLRGIDVAFGWGDFQAMCMHVGKEWRQESVKLGWICTQDNVILVEAHGGWIGLRVGMLAQYACHGYSLGAHLRVSTRAEAEHRVSMAQ
eukprot:464349-Amphidinium_carterae.5